MNRDKRVPERRWSAQTGPHCSQIQTRIHAIHGARQDGIVSGKKTSQNAQLPCHTASVVPLKFHRQKESPPLPQTRLGLEFIPLGMDFLAISGSGMTGKEVTVA